MIQEEKTCRTKERILQGIFGCHDRSHLQRIWHSERAAVSQFCGKGRPVFSLRITLFRRGDGISAGTGFWHGPATLYGMPISVFFEVPSLCRDFFRGYASAANRTESRDKKAKGKF